jgi:GT2 family glycosyltransferase
MGVDVSVIIVNYNAQDLLQECLDSVAAESARSGFSVETIIVDNDSTDRSVAFVREHFPDVRIVETGRNGGMAAGNNVGMLEARGRLFLLLNSDAHLQPGSLDAMVAGLDEGAPTGRVGMVGPRLLNADRTLQRSVRGFPSPWRLATEFWYLRRLAPRSRALNALYGGGFAHDRSADVEWVMGACMLVPRACVDDVGLMNEAYFMYSEETEWQHRMHTAGWRIRFCAEAEVVHLGGGTSRRSWGRMYRVQVASHVRCQAVMAGPATARRTRRVLSSALAFRTGLYRALALGAGGRRRAGLRERAAGFAGARAELAALDVADLARVDQPAWPGEV